MYVGVYVYKSDCMYVYTHVCNRALKNVSLYVIVFVTLTCLILMFIRHYILMHACMHKYVRTYI